MGGQFGHGFASAYLSQLAGGSKSFGSVLNSDKIGRAVISNAILQGSISEMTGGKFSNGAMTAAFRVAFNDGLDALETTNNARKAWGRVDDFIKNNPGEPIPVSKKDFEAMMSLSILDIDDFGHSGEGFYEGIQTNKADTRFFNNDGVVNYRDQSYIIEGYKSNNGRGVIGSTVNYIGIGIYTASANKSSAEIPIMVGLWNAKDIMMGRSFQHNVNQMTEGAYWGQVGFNYYPNPDIEVKLSL